MVKSLFKVSCLTPGLKSKITTFSPITVQSGISHEYTGHRNSGAAGTGSFWSPSTSRNLGYSTALYTQVADHPEVLTRAYRPTGGKAPARDSKTNTGDNQMTKGKHKNHQQKPRLLGIIRTQFSHHSKSWILQHTGKARFRFKITFHDDNRGL